MEELTFEERDLIQEVLGEHLEAVESGEIVYGNKTYVTEIIKSILAKVV